MVPNEIWSSSFRMLVILFNSKKQRRKLKEKIFSLKNLLIYLKILQA